MEKVLIISPHADDALLGAFSFLRDGNIVIIAANEKNCPKDKTHRIDFERKAKEINKVYDINTIPAELWWTVEVNKVYDRKYEIIKKIEEKINHMRPNTLLIPHPSYNQDHQTVYEACIIALRPHDINHFVPKVLVYEVYDYTNWGENQMEMNYFKKVDIKAKIKAYEKMKSQVRSYRSPDDLKRWAETVGRKCNLKYAEGFNILRYFE